MSNFYNIMNTIEISPFIADTVAKGYSLLATYFKFNPRQKIGRSLISFFDINFKRIKETSYWLHDIISFILQDKVEFIRADIISNFDTFLKFADTLDKESKEEVLNHLLNSLQWYYECYNSNELDCLEKFETKDIDEFLESEPLKVTTCSSRLFDISELLFEKMYLDFCTFIFPQIGLTFDSLIDSYQNRDASKAFHPTDLYKRSISVLTWPSTSSSCYGFDIDYILNDFSPDYIDILQKVYSDLHL